MYSSNYFEGVTPGASDPEKIKREQEALDEGLVTHPVSICAMFQIFSLMLSAIKDSRPVHTSCLSSSAVFEAN
jgi:hypothetical protein